MRRTITLAPIACACAAVAACGLDIVGSARFVEGDGPETSSPVPVRGDADAPVDGAVPGDAASPCAAQLDTDPNNCGRCSRSCLGTACVGGLCQADTLATRGSPQELVLDATDVYWTDPGKIGSTPSVGHCPKSGGPFQTITQAANGNPQSIALSSGRVLFTDPIASLVLSCAGGCMDANEATPQGIASNGSAVFWVNSGTGSIRRASATLGDLTTVVPGRSTPKRIAADAAALFWTVSNGVETSDTNGGGLVTIKTSGTEPRDLAIDATYVYWMTATELRRMTRTGEGDTLLASGGDLQRVTVDATGVYFTDAASGGRVLRCPTTGCATPEVLAVAEGSPHGIAVDATHVYWTNAIASKGTVRRVAK